MQSGIVFEWDEEAGEGFIIPSEEQVWLLGTSFEVLGCVSHDPGLAAGHPLARQPPCGLSVCLPCGAEAFSRGSLCSSTRPSLMRLDIACSRKGFQAAFKAAFKVPCPSELDPQSPVALRVRGLKAEVSSVKCLASCEIHFSLQKAYEVIPEGAGQPLLKAATEEPSAEEEELSIVEAQQDASLAPRRAFPVSPQRPELEMKRKVHPLLQRFAEEKPAIAEAESLRAEMKAKGTSIHFGWFSDDFGHFIRLTFRHRSSESGTD